jgi:hypothetical protein
MSDDKRIIYGDGTNTAYVSGPEDDVTLTQTITGMTATITMGRWAFREVVRCWQRQEEEQLFRLRDRVAALENISGSEGK